MRFRPLRFLVGLALMPTAVLAGALAIKRLFLISAQNVALPFSLGLLSCLALWLICRNAEDEGEPSTAVSLSNRVYVAGHEFSHALASWAFGGKVMGFHIGESSGHVDVTESNAFVFLAPYCFPLYSLIVIFGYRLWTWSRPETGREAFLFLMGLTLCFHLLKTFDCLWGHPQPDLAQAGGTVFSLSWILLANAFILLIISKVLFPGSVGLGQEFLRTSRLSVRFWVKLGTWLNSLRLTFIAQLRHS
jgi:hypothetical protein